MHKRMILLTVVILFLVSCTSAPQAAGNVEQVQTVEDEVASISDNGTGPDEEIHADTIATLSDTELTDSEIDGISYMREEEKLARDVYLAMADLWGMNIFANIAGSEDTHMDAVLTLIDFAGVEDPAQNANMGEFTNQQLQVLYDELMDQGSLGLAEALLVGGAIEEIDILDLQANLLETANGAVIAIYQNLLKGSINHLQTFVRNYERQTGEEYQPQYLSQEAFQSLMESSSSRGGGDSRGLNAAPQGRVKAQ